MEFWFITGSQHLYGEETLKQVAVNSRHMVEVLSKKLPFPIVWKETVTTPQAITDTIEEANFDKNCAGIITWMHTFSPSKMWIAGLTSLKKPYCHLHTQFNREIPFDTIDMDFMNLNQAAHGDREHGFIGARLRLPRKIVVGYWENDDVREKIADFMRVAVGYNFSKTLKVARFGDNMREVAVTEGDKVEAQIKLGWSVNYYPVGDLVEYINAVTPQELEEVYCKCIDKYTLATDNVKAVKEQIKYYVAMKKFLETKGCNAFTNTFEDLHGMKQLPGLATQMLMADGYGYGGEGDWKTSALTSVIKKMSQGLSGGTSFMEDYTYHLSVGNEMILGAHMLEVCPTIASDKPRIEVQPLGIGGKEPPARLKFNGSKGKAVCVSLVDMGGRMRLIVTDVEAAEPIQNMPNLPVASVMWRPLPNLEIAAEAWILCGGAHHTTMSYAVTAEHMRTLAEFWGIEFIHIGSHTSINELKKELMYNDIYYKLR